MIVFNKRKFIFINLLVILSISFYAFKNKDEQNFIVTSSLPSNGHTVILDAGHGFPDGGATSKDGTIIESSLNLDIVLKIQELLESSGTTVLLTRSDENGIYDTDKNSIKSQKISDMENRAKIANDFEADIFVSIHQNKLPQTQYSGWQSFYKNDDESSILLANFVQENLNYFISTNNNRKIKSISNIYLTKNVEIPMVIIECGFLSNTEEAEKLANEDYRELLSWSIYCGIMDYFKD